MMNDELSINPEKNKIPLDFNSSDKAVVALKSIAGCVPGIGPIVGELLSVVIPNQKLDRVILFLQDLAEKLSDLDTNVLALKMKQEEFTDLFEPALKQASNSLSDERRKYIANFLKVSLSSDEIDHLGEKKLLDLLGQVNDAEIIILKYYSKSGTGTDEEFFETHKDVLLPPQIAFGASSSDIDKYVLHKSYKLNLENLGLFQPVYKNPKKNELPQFDEKTGKLKSSYYQISNLGKTFLKYIDETYEDDRIPKE